MITRDFEKFDRVTQAEILSRILLMRGCRFDQTSILQRLAIDAQLELTNADLCGIEARLGLRVPAWERARYEVRRWLRNPYINLDFLEQAATSTPGVAGLRLGELLWKLEVAELPFAISRLWPANRKAINTGAHAALAIRAKGATSRGEVVREAQRIARRLKAGGLTPLMVADILAPCTGDASKTDERLVRFQARQAGWKIPRGTRVKASTAQTV